MYILVKVIINKVKRHRARNFFMLGEGEGQKVNTLIYIQEEDSMLITCFPHTYFHTKSKISKTKLKLTL